MKVRRYFPSFFEGFGKESAEVSTKEELLSLPWIACWKVKTHTHFAQDSDCVMSMHTLENGNRSWHVVAMVGLDSMAQLAEWLPKADLT